MSEKKVLIVGSGVAGMRAAYDLATAGINVTVIEAKTYTGGTLMQLDKQFPTDACGICRMQPRITGFPAGEFCLRKDFVFPGVEVLRDTTLVKAEDKKNGKKAVTLRRKGLFVDLSLCIGCGECAKVCPVEIEDEFNGFLSKRKAIDRASPQALFSLYTIDESACTKCGECTKVCPTNAITIGDDAEEVREFDAILLTPGFEEFLPTEMTEYGYKIFPDVVTSIELERLYSPAGPNFGKLVRPSDGKEPESVAFIQCVGSRTQEHPYCSSACCMYAMKEARTIRKLLPNAKVKIFFMDIRAFGKGYYRYEVETGEKGIEFTRCRVPKVYFDEPTEKLKIAYENDEGKRITEFFDLIVLSVGQVVTPNVLKLAESCGVKTDEWGFAELPKAGSWETTSKNVFAAGSFVSPKDIADAITEASAAAAEIAEKLGITDNVTLPTVKQNHPKNGKIGVVLCRCKDFIAGKIDLASVESRLLEKEWVEKVIQVDALCLADGLKKFGEFVNGNEFEEVVVAACQPYTHLVKLIDKANEASDNPPHVTMVDVLTSVNTVSDKVRTEFVLKQIAMEIARITHGRRKDFLYMPPEPKKPKRRVVVIGGGLAGLSAASTLIKFGVPVTIVESADKVGGVNIDGLGKLGSTTIGEYLSKLISELKENKDVEIITKSTVVDIQGSAGEFKVAISSEGSTIRKIVAGAVIVAVGADAHKTEKFGYGKSPKVLLWDEFERGVLVKEKPAEVVFIQCADSRNDYRPWCNRICCEKTMELAIKIKENNPSSRIWVLNRDIVTYGHNELDYLKARDLGVLFVRYTPDKEPEVIVEDKAVKVIAYDPIIGADIQIQPDYVVLQTGLDPHPPKSILEKIGSQDGFLNGLDPKFSPQETKVAGIFVAGSCRMPMRAEEAIMDGKAAAIQAAKYAIVESLPNRSRIAYVRERACVGCKYCIDACEYDARAFDEVKHKVYVNAESCMGCGACAIACPSEATVIIERDKNAVFAQIIEALAD